MSGRSDCHGDELHVGCLDRLSDKNGLYSLRLLYQLYLLKRRRDWANHWWIARVVDVRGVDYLIDGLSRHDERFVDALFVCLLVGDQERHLISSERRLTDFRVSKANRQPLRQIESHAYRGAQRSQTQQTDK